MASRRALRPSVDLFAGGNNTNFISQNGTFLVGFNGGAAGATTTETIGTSVFTGADEVALTAGVTGGGVSVTGDFQEADGPATFLGGGFGGSGTVYNLLAGAAWRGTSVTFSGLTEGQQYEIQLLVNDARGTNRAGYMLGVTDDATQDVWSGVANLNNTNSTDPDELSGDYLIGTFTADNTGTQTFAFGATRSFDFVVGGTYENPNNGQAQINALQLRAVPEPSSAALLGLGGLALILRRRK